MDDIEFVAAIPAAARLAKDAAPSPENAAKYFSERFAAVEKSEFQFPGHAPAPDDHPAEDVDPTRLGAR